MSCTFCGGSPQPKSEIQPGEVSKETRMYITYIVGKECSIPTSTISDGYMFIPGSIDHTVETLGYFADWGDIDLPKPFDHRRFQMRHINISARRRNPGLTFSERIAHNFFKISVKRNPGGLQAENAAPNNILNRSPEIDLFVNRWKPYCDYSVRKLNV